MNYDIVTVYKSLSYNVMVNCNKNPQCHDSISTTFTTTPGTPRCRRPKTWETTTEHVYQTFIYTQSKASPTTDTKETKSASTTTSSTIKQEDTNIVESDEIISTKEKSAEDYSVRENSIAESTKKMKLHASIEERVTTIKTRATSTSTIMTTTARATTTTIKTYKPIPSKKKLLAKSTIRFSPKMTENIFSTIWYPRACNSGKCPTPVSWITTTRKNHKWW